MKTPYTLHGWQLSYFSGKTRGYLNFKGIPFKDNNVNAYDLMVRIPKKTGATVMPAIQTNKGEWLQDTTMIMEELDKRHPESSVLPTTPKQLIASMLLEAWFDEYWIPMGMHYRWSYPENYDLFIHDASTALLPFVPNFIRRPLAVKIARGLQDFLPMVGVRPEQIEMMERRTKETLDILEIHFNQYAYLFGDKPSIADFALLGLMYGHLNRDPAPKRDLLDIRPKLQNWVERCHAGEGKNGHYLANDAIPETLMPILNVIGLEFIPMVKNTVKNTEEFVKEKNKQSGQTLPRAIGETTFPMHGEMFTRGALPYTVWMMQRIQDCVNRLTNEEQVSVNDFTSGFMNESMSELNLGPKLSRKAVTTRLA